MRLGLLAAARASFETARLLLKDAPSDSLRDNLAALREHEEYAESIGHDPNTMYTEFTGKGTPSAAIERESIVDVSVEIAQVDKLTEDAIALAERGDVLSSLPLFENAVKLNPKNAQLHMNVGVTQVVMFLLVLTISPSPLSIFTQMRLGLLSAARASLNTAKFLLNGAPSSSLHDNYSALEGHEKHAQSIGHNPEEMYNEFSKKSKVESDEYEDYYQDPMDDYVSAGSSVGVSHGQSEADRLTELAIVKAEGSELQAALELFQQAVDAAPKNGRMWENLGVTQMRSGLLEDAGMSFKTARNFDKSLDSSNINALKEHIEYRDKNKNEETAVNQPNVVSPTAKTGRYSNQVDVSQDDLAHIETQVDDTETSFRVRIDFSIPFGASLSLGARVEHVNKDGQFDAAGIVPGDRIAAMGTMSVLSLAQLKVAMMQHPNSGPVHILVVRGATSTDSAGPTSGFCDDGDVVEVSVIILRSVVFVFASCTCCSSAHFNH
jgi:Flp pilus assembly protein TadD